MKNQRLVVADSTIPGAGKGLFTLKNVPAGTRICTYEGERLSKEDLPIPNIFPRFDYVWTNNTLTIIIDGYNKTSFGPFMNDPADEAQCNADIVQRNSKVYVETTRELFSFEEVLTSYGGGYWADRFHLFLDPIGKHHSDFQLRLIRNYKIRPLPSGRALTNQEVLIKIIPLNYTIPDLPEETLLSTYVIDILRDTYGTSNTLSIQLGFPRFCRAKHLHTLLTEIQSFPIRFAADIIRKFLQKYPAITIHAWRLRDDSLYNTCRPDGTCGFQLLYQMHRRGRGGRNPDHFENIYLPKHLPGFKAFIKSLIEGYETTPTRTDPGAIPKLQFFLQWLERDPKPAFELKDWLNTDELFFLTALVEKHYTVMSYDPDRNAIPVLEDRENWIYLYHDTEFPGVAPSFNLHQIEVLLRRNNFALFSHSHFYPFPTTTSLIDDLNRAFTSLAERLLDNYAGVKPRSNLSVLPMVSLGSTPDHPLPRVPAHREYHDTPRLTPTPHPSDTFITVQDSPDRPRVEESNPDGLTDNMEASSTLGGEDILSSSRGEHLPPISDTECVELSHSVNTTQQCEPWTDPKVSIGLFESGSPEPKVPHKSKQRVGMGPIDRSWMRDFMVHKVPGDGECFFSSVNYIMRTRDKSWKHTNISLRNDSLKQLERTFFQFYTSTNSDQETVRLRKEWNQTKDRFKHKGQYADHELMTATAILLNIDIQIHGGINTLLTVEGRVPSLTINLLYSGAQVDLNRGNHYDPLIPKEVSPLNTLREHRSHTR